MKPVAVRPDIAKALAPLKGFQRATVDYAFDRLYGPNPTRRFLVADEVGLGKTLVARGVIARAVHHLWDTVDRIDIIYICSNGDIARQNINRLNITGDRRFQLASRVTLLPTVLRDLENSKLNFVSFTPGTSFDLKSSLGRQDERVLLYHLLRQAWRLKSKGAMNVLQGGVRDTEAFRDRIRRFEATDIDPSLSTAFGLALEETPRIRERFDDLCRRFGYARKNIPEEDRRDRSALIGELRGLLAQTCLRGLQPDLIILDEFQRFKTLLDGEDEAASLAQALFSYSDSTTEARVLLLSATPYKMFTLHHERAEDDHYADFLRTVEFLDPAAAAGGSFRDLLQEYRRKLYDLPDGGFDRLISVKAEIETQLRRTMCRTERIGTAGAIDGMLREVPMPTVRLDASDVRAFRCLQRTATTFELPQVVEYWKSAPYLFNFMEGYKLKERFRNTANNPRRTGELADQLCDSSNLLMPFDRVESYEALDLANARLRGLLEPMLAQDVWRLLWVPPTLPYHRLEGPFATAHAAGITKRLVFSTWTVVPRALTAIASYEIERRIFTELEAVPRNTAEWRARRRGLLRFALTDGRLVGMPTLTLLYPSFALAALGDPLIATDAGGEMTVAALVSATAQRLAPAIAKVVGTSLRTGEPDEAWYWAVPLLLDLADDRALAQSWLDRSHLPQLWTGADENDDDDPEEEDSRWAEHVEEARRVAEMAEALGPPPSDLSTVVALIALASPAVTALRALTRSATDSATIRHPDLRDAAAQIAWGFRTLLNQPESSAIVRIVHRNHPFWRAALQYGADGCLQAVLDEYCHILRDSLGLFDMPPEGAAPRLKDTIRDALMLRTSRLRVDDVRVDPAKRTVDLREASLRSHFAMRFGAQDSDDGRQALREDQVRHAFMSPFRPFILASTSVGQEGLDFHPYCHAVVHWNLPSNPVDLEQREGRVHRYKGHAVRKNIARAYGQQALAMRSGDTWQHAFDLARAACTNGDHGLVPYWVFQVPDGAAVERHVPILPLSVDAMRLDALKRSLAVYRMVFGQPRQDDLMAYLLERIPEERLRELAPLLKIDLTPEEISHGTR